MQGFSLAIKLKATKADLDSMIGIHPTAAEIFSRVKFYANTDFYISIFNLPEKRDKENFVTSTILILCTEQSKSEVYG